MCITPLAICSGLADLSEVTSSDKSNDRADKYEERNCRVHVLALSGKLTLLVEFIEEFIRSIS